MEVEFYFDPSCPFCWITSRWLIQVKDEREIHIVWRPFSLAMKNNVLDPDETTSNEHAESYRQAHRIIRVIMAAKAQGADIGDLYSAFGTERHIMGDRYDDNVIKKVLQSKRLPESLLASADDQSLDSDIRASLNSAIEIVGDDVGVPTIIFNINSKRTGYFGPVLQELPGMADSMKLWDGLVNLVSIDGFYELKRSRPSGGPDTGSTAICRV